MKRFFKKILIAAAAAAVLSIGAASQVQAAETGYRITLREIDGWRYAYDSAGNPFTGWFQIGDAWYFSGIGGGIVYGDRGIDGKAYTFASDGTYVCEGVHRDGFEDDIYNMAIVKTDEYWSYYAQALDFVNAERASNGLAPLRLDRDLCVIATYRACHMGKYGYSGHYDASGKGYYTAAAKQYFGRHVLISENIDNKEAEHGPTLVRQLTPDIQVREAHASLLTSPPHKKLMNDPTDTSAGFGLYSSPSRVLFVQLFAML